MARTPRKIKKCTDCPMMAKMPYAMGSNRMSDTLHPFCFVMRRHLGLSKAIPIECPMRGKLVTWDKI